MKRLALALIIICVVLATAFGAELRQAEVPMDRVPSEYAEPSLKTAHWWDVPHIPLDHPYWWTLTDELTPAELLQRVQERHTRLLLDAEEEMRRTGAAQATGIQQRTTVWVLDGQETPELFAAWDALDAFAAVMVSRNLEEERQRELLEFGISPSASAQIVAIAVQVAEKQVELWREKFREGQRLRKLLETVASTRGENEARMLRKENDLAALASASGTPIDQVREIARWSSLDTTAEAAVPMMVALRSIIGDGQWNLFRQYLLANVAPYMKKSAVLQPEVIRQATP